jgi:hypothetical protein
MWGGEARAAAAGLWSDFDLMGLALVAYTSDATATSPASWPEKSRSSRRVILRRLRDVRVDQRSAASSKVQARRRVVGGQKSNRAVQIDFCPP